MRHQLLVPIVCLALLVSACDQEADGDATNGQVTNSSSPQDTTQVTSIAPNDEPRADLTALATGFRNIDPDNPPDGSPIARALTYVDDAYVHVVYSQPYLRGREAFGEIVPLGEVWAAGAHFATELLVTRPLRIEGERLDAGAYSLFITPESDEWTVHINTELGSHSTGRYDASNDVLTLQAPVQDPGSIIDPFTIRFEEGDDAKIMNIGWQQSQISLRLTSAS